MDKAFPVGTQILTGKRPLRERSGERGVQRWQSRLIWTFIC